MPRIEFDAQRCVGHALCNATAPEVYHLDENGYCETPPEHVGESQRDAAVRGAEACPERVLTVT